MPVFLIQQDMGKSEMLNAILSVVYPCFCVNCGKPVLYNERNLCGNCLRKIKFLKDGCPRCSGIIADDECTVCGGRFFYPEKNIVVGEYSSVLKKVITSLKFDGCSRLSAVLSDLARERLILSNLKADVIVPVPVFKKKKWQRGFNQCELIAKKMSVKTGIQTENLLKEIKGASTQRKLGYRDRFINVLGRYGVKHVDKIKNRRILLVDDIFTTGATINECARVLLEAGADSVFSITLARADIKKLEK